MLVHTYEYVFKFKMKFDLFCEFFST